MYCAHHQNDPATTACAACGRALCENCAIRWEGKTLCKQCLEAQATWKREPVRLRKSPLLAGLLSLLPGAGQVYLGYYVSGFVNILVVAGLIALLNQDALGKWEPFLGTFLSFFWIFNIIDATRRARLYNEFMMGEVPERVPTDSPLVGGVVLLVVGLLLTLQITLGVSVAFLEPLWPLAVLAGGIYLTAKYVRTRRELAAARDRDAASARDAAAGAASEPGRGARFGENRGSIGEPDQG